MSCDHFLVGKDCFCCSSVSKSYLILWDPRDCSMQVSSVLQCLPKFANSGPLSQWCYLTISSSAILLSFCFVFPSIRVFSNESTVRIRWPKYWNFSFSVSPSNEYSVLISFNTDCVDLAVQVTLKSLLQHHSSKASILQCSIFFIVQLSLPYRTTGKTIALTRQTLAGKVMFLLFSTMSIFVIAFL